MVISAQTCLISTSTPFKGALQLPLRGPLIYKTQPHICIYTCLYPYLHLDLYLYLYISFKGALNSNSHGYSPERLLSANWAGSSSV